MRACFCVLVFLWAATLSGRGEARIFASGPGRVSLVELYTSEGCSSCPPAEAWLSGLMGEAGLWRDFVPVAFHVDYWNSLGWTDQYSTPEYSERQNAYAASWGSGAVYTPEYVLNGREWRPGTLPGVGGKTGTLKVTVEKGRGSVAWNPMGTEQEYTALIAPLGNGILTDVRRGENAGRRLPHDFVALGLVKVRLRAGADGRWTGSFDFPENAQAGAMAVWVVSADGVAPLQAAGGLLR